MSLLQEVLSTSPEKPEGGWNVGHLANLGLILSAEGISVRLDLFNLNLLFDLIEANESGEVRDHQNRIVEVQPQTATVVLKIRGDETYPNGVVLDAATLKEMGLEEYEEQSAEEPSTADAEPSSSFDPLEDEDTISQKFDALEEGIYFKRPAQKLKAQSNFRQQEKIDLAAFKISVPGKKFVRLLKGDPLKLKHNEIQLRRS
jgi:hypothetical protein